MNHRTLRCVLLTALACILPAPPAFGYVTDTASHAPSAYETFTPPSMNGTYTDSVFGTDVRRLSSAPTSTNTADGGSLTYVMSEYSTVSAFNQDRSLVLLQHDSYFGLYDGQGVYIADLPFAVHAGSQPRWSRTDPHVLYFLNDNRLRTLDVLEGQISTVRTFSEYGSVTGNGEADISEDGDHMVLAGDGEEIFIYEISSDTKSQVFNTGGRGFDSIYITPDNQVTVTWYQSGSSRYNGIELFDRNMSFVRQVTRAGGHMDVTRDTNGDAVLVWTNSADPAPICNNGAVKVRLSDGEQTCLQEFDWSLALNISCPDDAGSCIVATYAPGDPSPSGSWPAYTNEIVQVMLDGSEVRRLAHHRSRPHNSYNYTPRPVVSRDGTRVVFSSNYHLQVISGATSNYSDAYMVSAPATDGSGGGTGGGDDGTGGGDGGGTPTGTSSGILYEEDASSLVYTGTWHDNAMTAHSGGGAVLSMDAGSRVQLTFDGTGVRWIGYRDEWSGIAAVYVDGVHVDTVDTYASPAQAQATLFSVDGLADGSHTLEIEATGDIGSASSGSWVWVDALETIAGSTSDSPDSGGGDSGPTGGGTSEATRIEESDSAVVRQGTWHDNGMSVHSGGAAILAMDPGARVELSFTGTGVRWIGYSDEWSGMAKIFVDGVHVDTIDTYATPSEAQASLFTVKGLTDGSHTLAIEATGTSGSASSGAWIWVDGFEVLSGSTTSTPQTSSDCTTCVSLEPAD